MTEFTGHDLHCLRGGRMVFAGLDFKMESGQALVLVGPNGSGKSTLLRIMAGLLQPILGDLTWDGEPVDRDPEERRRRTEYVGHLDAVKPMLTVMENIHFWATLRGAGTAERLARALDVLDLAPLADLPGRMLSAGQKRRVNLARILVSDAPLWLLDEPVTALDKRSIAALEAAIAAHRAQGGMVVLSTHSDMGLGAHATLDLNRFASDASALEIALEVDG